MAQIRQKTLDEAVLAAGEPGSDERADQIRDLALSNSPCPEGMSVGDQDWSFWLDSRKKGCILAESARCLQQKGLKEAADRARRGLANARDSKHP